MNKEELKAKLTEDPNYTGETDEEKALITEIRAETDKGKSKVTKSELEDMITAGAKKAISDAVKPLKEQQDKIISTLADSSHGKDEESWKEDVKNLIKALVRKDFATAKTIVKQIEGVEYVIPQQYVERIYELLPTYGVVRRNCSIVPMTAERARISTWLTDMELEFVGSTHAKKVLSGTFGHEWLICKKLAGIIPLHTQDVEDATIDLVEFFRPRLARAWAKAEDKAVFLGNAGASVSGINNVATVYYISSNSILNVTLDDLKHLTEAVTDPATEGAKFYMSRSVFNVLRNIKDTTGNYIYQKPSEKTPGMIWDFPYEVVNILPGTSSDGAGVHFIYFGNLEHYVIGDRQSLTFKTSEEATIKYTDAQGKDQEYNLFQMDMMGLKAVVREAFQPLHGSEAFAVLSTAGAS